VPPRTRPPAVPATWDRVLARRVAAHHLDEPATDGLVPLVRRLCGVHAQLASAAEAAIWLRTGGTVGPAQLRRAVAVDRTLVKTWALRGTLHLLPAADLPMWVAALGTRSFPRPKSWYAYHGVTPEDMAALEAVVPEVLGGTPMTREELATAVARRAGRPQLAVQLRSGWGAVLKPMAARGQLAFGPPDGRSVTFVAPREWLGEWAPVEPERAVAELVRAILDGYGPFGLDELTRWTALDRPVLRAAVAALGDELVELDTEGDRGWVTAAGAAAVAAAAPSPVVRLLPGFDPYVVGALRQLDRLVPTPERTSAVSRTSGWISPVLLDGGRIAGTWAQESTGGRLALTITPFGRLRGGVREAAEAEAARWADYAGASLDLTWAEP
jgi:Winged helix DNA-binding domain